MIPSLSILFMAVTAVIVVALPIALLILVTKKHGAKVVPALVGAGAFMIFAMGFEQILHAVVLKPGADGGIALLQKPALYILYGAFAAGVFEENARFLSFKLLLKKYTGIGNAVSYGVGHGGAEAILIVGLNMISSLVLSLVYNSGSAAALSGPPTNETIAAAVTAIAEAKPYLFLVSGFERVISIVIHIALSVIVFLSVCGTGKRRVLFPLAILLHAFVNVPAAMYQTGVIKNVIVTESLIAVFAALFAVFAFFLAKKLAPAPEPECELPEQAGPPQ